MWIRSCFVSVLFLVLVVGCSPGDGPKSCQTNGDCDSGQRCVRKVCTTPSSTDETPAKEPASEGTSRETNDTEQTPEGGSETTPEPEVELPPEEPPKERATLCSNKVKCPDPLGCKEGLCQQKCGSSSDCPDAKNYICNGGLCQRKCNIRLGKAVNPVCVTGSYCEGYCIGSPLPQTGSRSLGEICSFADSALFCDGSKGLFCYKNIQATNPLCAKVCDPRDGVGKNPACSEGQLCQEDVNSYEQGRCVSPATQKDGDFCDFTDKRCQAGLVCFRGLCRPGCELDKGRQNNPACPKPSEYVCNELNDSGKREGVCLERCEPYKGVGACPVGSFCFGGFCLPSQGPPSGKGVAGEACSGSTGVACDGSKGLFCPVSFSLPKCSKACDPRKGEVGNVSCGTGENCIEDNDSYLQGRCIPPPSRKVNETCDSQELRCMGNLLCVQGVCHKPCGPLLGGTTETQCAGVGTTNSVCWGGVCKGSCDIRSGIVINPECPVGTYCQKTSSNAQIFLGYCSYSPLKQAGTRKHDETCSTIIPKLFCDGSTNLFCHIPEQKCVRACDPRKGSEKNPLCGTGQLCVEDLQSFLQGRCVANNVRKKGEPCTLDFPCAKGLFCRSGKCGQPCDTTKGTSSNTVCATNEYCNAIHNVTEVIGFCDPLPAQKNGPKQLGDDCSNFSASRYCDAGKGLVCDPFSSKCIQGCNPKNGIYDNKSCGQDTQCLEDFTFTHLGGYCVKLTQIFTGFCDSKQFRCKKGLVCVNSVCRGKCNPALGVTANPECTKYGNGYLCDGQFQVSGICVVKCDPTKGSLRNTVCPAGTYCATAGGALNPGVCRDVPDSGGTATEGQACDTFFNTPTTRRCKKDLACVDGACRKACDPKDAQPNRTCVGNTVCVASSVVYSGGACLSPATQKAGALCFKSLSRCSTGLVCRGACTKPCDIKKGAKSNPDCDSGDVCVADARGDGACFKPCDPSKGAPLNAACGVGSFCAPDKSGTSGTCQFSPPTLDGPRGKGLSCSNSQFAFACNGKSKLFCSKSLCLTACDPRVGVKKNPNCGTNEECLVDPESYLQGRCQPQPTQQAENWCDRLTKLCLPAYTCMMNMCHVPCDPTKGVTGNTDCTRFAAGARCIASGTTGVCRRTCDRSKGSLANVDCSVGTYCIPQPGKPGDPVGLCQPLSPPAVGTKQLDEPCQSNFPGLECDGSKNLVCAFGTCRPVCDPRLKGSDCPFVAGKLRVCSGLVASFKGGFCQ